MLLIPLFHVSWKTHPVYTLQCSASIFTLLSALYTCRSWDEAEAFGITPSMIFKNVLYLDTFPLLNSFSPRETRSSPYLKRIPITSSQQIQLYNPQNINMMLTTFLPSLASRNRTLPWSSPISPAIRWALLHNDHRHCPGLYLALLFIPHGLRGLFH